jgi:hypothetical protein
MGTPKPGSLTCWRGSLKRQSRGSISCSIGTGVRQIKPLRPEKPRPSTEAYVRDLRARQHLYGAPPCDFHHGVALPGDREIPLQITKAAQNCRSAPDFLRPAGVNLGMESSN